MKARRLAALVATATLIPVTGVVVAATTAHAECAGTMIFEVGGTGDPTGTITFGRYNTTLPDDVAATPISYPAEIWPLPKPGTTDQPSTHTLDESVAVGTQRLSDAVHAFHAACPGSRILITGHSQGALVAGDVLGALARSDAIPHDQIDGVLYADPRRIPASGVAGGVETNLPTFMEGMSMRGPRGFGDIAVHQICNQNDGICLSPNPFTNLLAFANSVAGYLTGAHGYAIDPLADRGAGDTVIPQAPIIQYGPPLPIPAPTPYEALNGKLPAHEVRMIVAAIADAVYGALPAAQQGKLREFWPLGAATSATAAADPAATRLLAAQRSGDPAAFVRALQALVQQANPKTPAIPRPTR